MPPIPEKNSNTHKPPFCGLVIALLLLLLLLLWGVGRALIRCSFDALVGGDDDDDNDADNDDDDDAAVAAATAVVVAAVAAAAVEGEIHPRVRVGCSFKAMVARARRDSTVGREERGPWYRSIVYIT